MHPPVRAALIDALKSVVLEGKYTDQVLERMAKQNRKFGSRDRRQLAEALYSCVRFWLRWSGTGLGMDEVVKSYLNGEIQNQDFSALDLNQRLGIHPEFMARLLQEFDEPKAEALIESMDRQADVFLRPNTLRTDLAALERQLSEEGLEVERLAEPSLCLRLKKRGNLFQSQAFKKGLFEVQDSGSQAVVLDLKLEPGERVVDACAGAGGKALQMAALMKNKGKIIAMDIHSWKLDELRKRARRAGVDIIETRPIDSSKTLKRLHSSSDVLLLDVPCTGSGVLKRMPDTKLKFREARWAELVELQAEILQDYSKILKPGGRMLYATCSILPSENQHQVKAFLEKNPEWVLQSEKSLMPTEFNSDAFYSALLVKPT